MFVLNAEAKIDIKKLSKNSTVYSLLKSSGKIKELSRLSNSSSNVLSSNVILRGLSRFFVVHYKKELKIEDKNRMYEKILLIASKRNKLEQVLNKTLKNEYKNLEALIATKFTKKELIATKLIYKSKIAKEFTKTKSGFLDIKNYSKAIKKRVSLLKKYKNSKKLSLIRKLCKNENLSARFCDSKDFAIIYLDRYKGYSDKKLKEFILFVKQEKVTRLNFFTNQWFKKSYMKSFGKYFKNMLLESLQTASKKI
jgi:hypothetical protein